MTNITVNRKMRTLEITKSFNRLASRYGTDEYNLLQKAKADNPGFKVVVKSSSSKKRESYKGLTFKYMEKYIEDHDNEEKTIMAEFKTMRAETDEAREAFAESMSYKEIKDWFFLTYPVIAEFHKKREKLMEDIDKKKKDAEDKANKEKKAS